jgi:hypothetical protein
MPYSFTIDSDRGVLLLRAEAEINDREAIAVARQIASDPQFHRGLRFFTDLRPVTRNSLTGESLVQIVKILKLDSGPRRVVVVGNVTNYGVCRMYQTYCDMYGVSGPEIFWSGKEALAYLNEGASPEKVVQLDMGDRVTA